MPHPLRSLLALTLVGVAPALWAQPGEATLVGRVLGPQGQPLAEATLRLRFPASGLERVARVDAQGHYRLAGLPLGECRLQVEAQGAVVATRRLVLTAADRERVLDLRVASPASGTVVVEGHLAIPTSAELGKVRGNLKDFPQSAVAVPAVVLQDTGSMKLDQALSLVSGATPSSSSNYGFFDNHLLRGMQVVYLRNGLPDGTTYMGYTRSVWDAEQVEVLKGPGSALFGNGGPGGSVNIVSRKPQLEAASQVQFSEGSFGSRAGMVDVTGPMGSASAYRVIADDSAQRGFRDLSARTLEVLPSASWHLGADQELLAQLEYRRVQQKPDAVGIPFHVSTTKNSAGAFPYLDPTLVAVPRETSYVTPFADSVNELFRLSFTHTWTPRQDFTLRSVAAYGTRDLTFDRNFVSPNFTSATTLDGRYLRDQQDRYKDLTAQTEGSWTLRAGGVTHALSLGVDLWKGDIDTTRKQAKLAPIADVYHPALAEQRLTDLDYAFIFDRSVAIHREGLYLTDQTTFSEQWKARVTLRRDHFRMDDDGIYNNAGNSSFNSTLDANGQSYTVKALTLAPGLLHTDEWFWNGQAGLVYAPLPTTSFFGGVSWGRLANITTEDPRSAFRPESNRQEEVGNRTTLLGGNLSFSAALYRTTRFNVPQSSLVGNDVVVTLIPKQQTKGLDVDLSAKPAPGWFLLAAAAWMDPRFQQALPGDLTQGLTLTGVPRRTQRLWASYERPEGALKGLGMGLGLRGRSEVVFWSKVTPTAPASPYLLPLVLPAYTLVDASLFYRQATWDLQVSVKNLTDRTWWAYGVISSGVPGEPRSVQVDLRKRF